MAYISSLGLIARVGVGVAILAGMCGLGAIVQCVRDQHKPVVCEEGERMSDAGANARANARFAKQKLAVMSEAPKLSNIEALEELVEWGTVTLGYTYAVFEPNARHQPQCHTNGGYGPDLLPELWEKVKETVG